MGLYELPLSMSLFCFGMGPILANFHIMWYYVVLEGGVVLCYVCCEFGLFVLGGYLRISGAPSVQSCSPFRYLLPNVCLYVADIANPDLFACICQTCISPLL